MIRSHRAGAAAIYIANGNCKFWSVGPDGHDDKGAPMTKAIDAATIQGTGDLWLADFFRPDEPKQSTPGKRDSSRQWRGSTRERRPETTTQKPSAA